MSKARILGYNKPFTPNNRADNTRRTQSFQDWQKKQEELAREWQKKKMKAEGRKQDGL